MVKSLRRSVMVVLVALALAGAWVASGEPQVAPPARTSQGADVLKVMSFNIRYGTARDGDNAWELRRGAVIEVIEAFGADVLGLQEALHFQLEELAAAMPRYQRIGVGRTDGVEAGEYAAILIDRSRLEVLAQGTFWFSDTPEVPGSTSWGNDIPRICTWARLRDRASGRALWVYNVHWDHISQPSRERSAALLMQTIARRAAGGEAGVVGREVGAAGGEVGAAGGEVRTVIAQRAAGGEGPAASAQREPVLVTGDFNAGETNPAFRRLLFGRDEALDALQAPEPALFDTFRALHPEVRDVGTFNGFEGVTTGEKIDAILVSEGWEIIAAEIVRAAPQGRDPSDHFPVTATLRAFGEGGGSATSRRFAVRGYWPSSILKAAASRLSSPPSRK